MSVKVVWQAEYDEEVQSESFESESAAEDAVKRKILEGRITQVEWVVVPQIEWGH